MLPKEIVGDKMDGQKLYDSVNLLLYLQRKNGGLAAWEPVVAPKWLEVLNPTEFFDNVVVEHEYVECTASVVQALVLYKELHPGHRRKEIEESIKKRCNILRMFKGLMDLGTGAGEFALHMVRGMRSEDWQLLEGLVAIVQLCKKALNFLLPNS